ncbi:glycosyltransferase family 28 C-terminal domain-containing protein [Mycena olivaceomarginata]|nr:glycosyltransferase family 28 C-terminal domain-containing protein [Mycena olivaceomarginata]
MLTFVTVGTFQFDQLVQTVLSEAVLGALRERGYTQLVVQCGKSDFELAGAVVGGNTVTLERNGVRVELWRSRESLDAEYRRADLVIGHAGAGTILEVLRLGKPLIVVPNPTLLHNHQTELAGALAPYLRTSSIHDLADTIASFDPGAMQKFPSFDGSRFRALVDSEMGF